MRGKGKNTLALVDAAHHFLDENNPATVRAVCYRLFTDGLIPNMSKASTDKVSKALVWAREQYIVPWHWIVDETREAEVISSWDNPESIWRAATRSYRKDYWADQPERVEVWSEKGTVRGTLAPVLNKYGVTFRVMHGFGSATAVYDAARSADGEKPLTVLYVGDYDPSGMCMSEHDLPERLERYGGDLELERVALVDDDLADLPSFPAASKKGDSRARWFVEEYGHRCWELDAMSPADLRTRIEQEIKLSLDMDLWERCIEIEAIEKQSMSEFLTAWSKSRQSRNLLRRCEMSIQKESLAPAGTGRKGTRQTNYRNAHSSQAPIEKLLARLEHVRSTGNGQYMARCPAHEDRSPSLAVRENDDGGVLIHCFADCTALEVVNAAGLEWIDIIPEHQRYRANDGKATPKRDRWDYRALLRHLSFETTVVIIAANDLAQHGALPDADRQRLTQAAIRIARVMEVSK